MRRKNVVEFAIYEWRLQAVRKTPGSQPSEKKNTSDKKETPIRQNFQAVKRALQVNGFAGYDWKLISAVFCDEISVRYLNFFST